jgi:hypothetical protein
VEQREKCGKRKPGEIHTRCAKDAGHQLQCSWWKLEAVPANEPSVYLRRGLLILKRVFVR